MTTRIEFYFDFISPYGYLGSLLVEELAERLGCEVDWCPMLLGVSVMGRMGLPPLLETPLKGPYVAVDFQRSLRFHGVPLNRYPGAALGPLPPGRAFTYLKDHAPSAAKAFAQAVYRGYWSEARDVGSPAALGRIGVELGLDGAAIEAACSDERVKLRHRECVEASLERGVFGSPSFIVDGELFWGHDRLPQLERWIQTGGF